MKNSKLGAFRPALLCLAAASTCAFAEEGITYKISGYGTLAATVIDKSDLQFRTSLSQSKGANSSIDLGVDSRLGLQGVVNFGQGWSATAQVLSTRRRVDATLTSNKDFDIDIEWLFAQWSASPNLDLRLGRVVLPSFMISDSRNVGYSQPWLRAPIEMYGRMPLTSMDGIQAVWRIPVGDAVFSVQPGYGKSSVNVTSKDLIVEGPNKWVAHLSGQVEWGDWLMRAGQVRGVTPVNLNLLPTSLTTIPVSYDMKDTFSNVGVQYDNGKAIVMAEWAKRTQNDLPATAPAGYADYALGAYLANLAGKPLTKESMWYLAAGWRFGKWLPMISYGNFKATVNPTQWASTNLSIRYDVANNVALKAQIGRHKAKDSTSFVMVSDTDPRSVTSVAVGVDFVF